MEKLSEIEQRFLTEAKQKRRKIGIGIIDPQPEVVKSLIQASDYADLVVVGSKIDGLNCIPTQSEEEASQVLVDLVKSGKVEGLMRAQLKDSYTHKLFLQAYGRPEDQEKISVSFFAKDGQWFATPSISNYSGLTLESKRNEISQAIAWLENNLGIKPTIAITSTRRLTGRVGEFALVEEIAKRCEIIANELREKGYDVKEYYIEYEKAIWEGRNLICPSIGMIGNTWTKGLAYLGGWRWLGIAYLNQGVYYNNAPKNNKNWFWPVIFSVAWINRGKL
ncbi:MAG: hypothetical protein WC675_01800 [Patescibacteria group bacterium]|jgi:predicted methyltransferase MtxX (methanogen marker protein 4)